MCAAVWSINLFFDLSDKVDLFIVKAKFICQSKKANSMKDQLAINIQLLTFYRICNIFFRYIELKNS